MVKSYFEYFHCLLYVSNVLNIDLSFILLLTKILNYELRLTKLPDTAFLNPYSHWLAGRLSQFAGTESISFQIIIRSSKLFITQKMYC